MRRGYGRMLKYWGYERILIATLLCDAVVRPFENVRTTHISSLRSVLRHNISVASEPGKHVHTHSSPTLADGLLAEPHGGKLIDLMTEDVAGAVKKCNKEIQLSPRQLCDVELIMNGGFSPLTGFMDEVR